MDLLERALQARSVGVWPRTLAAEVKSEYRRRCPEIQSAQGALTKDLATLQDHWRALQKVPKKSLVDDETYEQAARRWRASRSALIPSNRTAPRSSHGSSHGSSLATAAVIVGVILWILNSGGAFGGKPEPDEGYNQLRCAQLQGEVDATAQGVNTGGFGAAFERGKEMNDLNC